MPKGGTIEAELRELLDAEDPRTIAEMKDADETADTGPIKRVTPYDGGYSIEWASSDGGTYGIGLADDRNPDKFEPKAGDTITVYGRFGGEVHGIDINGREMFWRTPLERVADRVSWLANHDRDKRERFVKDRARIDALYEELPPPLKARIDRFRAERPDFRIDSEAYEFAAVADAPKIALALAEQHEWALDDDLAVTDESVTPDAINDAIKAFYDLPYEKQKQSVPNLDDGHSGNTFGAAVGLAGALLRGQEV